MIPVRATVAAVGAVMLLSACGTTVAGTPTWPGAALARAALTATDFPPGVEYEPIAEKLGEPDGAGMPGSMQSVPEGCSNGFTNVIATNAERGPGSAVKYWVMFQNVRIMMTLVSFNLPLEQLRAVGEKCARFEAFFSSSSEGVPFTTTDLVGAQPDALAPDALAYEQTMNLHGTSSTVTMAFQNVGSRGLFAVAFPVRTPDIAAKASLPQTFLDIFAQQVSKLRIS